MKMVKPLREQFEISRMKVNRKKSSVEIFYTVEDVIGKEHYYDTHRIESVKIPHPDLTTKLLALKPIMINSIGRQPDLSDTVNFGVTGIAVSGVSEKGVIIMGTYKCKNETNIAIVTPRIKLSDAVWGFEDELEGIVEELTTEAYLYIFEDKQAQLTMEFGNDTSEE